MATWEDLLGIVRRLRAPGGCPWDRAQTHRSLRRYVLEEAREVACAIDEDAMHELLEELGDLLLQVLLHAVIAEEEAAFGPGDVLGGLADKLVRRHPHVFGAASAGSVAEVRRTWDELKRAERPVRAAGLLDGVARTLPALAEAEQLGKRAAAVGFDWGEPALAWEKVREEAEEFARTWTAGAPGEAEGAAAAPVEEEFGDLLFALVNVARLLDVDPEAALDATNEKFRRRFAAIEAGARQRGREVRSLGLDEMEALWQSAKGPGKGRRG